MKRVGLVCLAVLLGASVWIFAGPSIALAAAEPIVLGCPTSLYTPYGSETAKAAELAVEEINAAGGVKVGNVKRPFKLVVSDTRGGEPGTPVHDSLMAYELREEIKQSMRIDVSLEVFLQDITLADLSVMLTDQFTSRVNKDGLSDDMISPSQENEEGLIEGAI